MQGAPSRPWFRLATMVRPPSPQQLDPPPPPPPSRPAFIRPAATFTRAAPPPQLPTAPSPTLETKTPPPSPSIKTVKPATILNPHPPSPQLKSSNHPTQEYNERNTPKSDKNPDNDIGMIITVSGENKGAIMDLGKFAGNYINKKSTDGEKSEENKKNHKPFLMNSNVQGVNNSILYNCSITHHDPGLRLSLLGRHRT